MSSHLTQYIYTNCMIIVKVEDIILYSNNKANKLPYLLTRSHFFGWIDEVISLPFGLQQRCSFLPFSFFGWYWNVSFKIGQCTSMIWTRGREDVIVEVFLFWCSCFNRQQSWIFFLSTHRSLKFFHQHSLELKYKLMDLTRGFT